MRIVRLAILSLALFAWILVLGCGALPRPIAPDRASDAGLSCDANLETDPKNCGACGHACTPPANTAQVTCIQGDCQLAQCQGGFADCDLLYADGCEVNLFAATSSCGLCGYSCPTPPHALSAACVRPQGCAVGECLSGFGNCDGLVWNGCESSLSSDTNNCGACGAACPAYFSMDAGCQAGACAFACIGEFYDVDGNLKNGCETQDSPLGNHTQTHAIDLGAITACGSGGFTEQIIGNLPSDKRAHPSLAVRSNNTVEDWYAITPRGEPGGSRDLDFQLIATGNGAAAATCFQATFITNQGSFSAQTTNKGTVTLGGQADAYTTPSRIYVKVEKLVSVEGCAAPVNEDVVYFINYHL